MAHASEYVTEGKVAKLSRRSTVCSSLEKNNYSEWRRGREEGYHPPFPHGSCYIPLSNRALSSTQASVGQHSSRFRVSCNNGVTSWTSSYAFFVTLIPNKRCKKCSSSKSLLLLFSVSSYVCRLLIVLATAIQPQEWLEWTLNLIRWTGGMKLNRNDEFNKSNIVRNAFGSWNPMLGGRFVVAANFAHDGNFHRAFKWKRLKN